MKKCRAVHTEGKLNKRKGRETGEALERVRNPKKWHIEG